MWPVLAEVFKKSIRAIMVNRTKPKIVKTIQKHEICDSISRVRFGC
jgi:hypothetical protein